MKRRKWKPEQKALIVLERLKGRPIGELCAEHEISQAQYYQWREHAAARAPRCQRGARAGALSWNGPRAACRGDVGRGHVPP
jgi:transposase-like protein